MTPESQSKTKPLARVGSSELLGRINHKSNK